jgi:hypothetical protein
MFLTSVATWFLSGLLALGVSFGGDLRLRGDSRSRVGHTSFGGDIVVQRAHGAHLRSFGGNVRLGKTDGLVWVSSYGGRIHIESLAGSARLTSRGGEVEVHVVDQTSDAPRDIRIHSYGGEVVVQLPEDFDATVEIRTRSSVNRPDEGEVRSDFALQESSRRVRPLDRLLRSFEERTATATLGSGRHRISIETDGGDVELRRGSSES